MRERVKHSIKVVVIFIWLCLEAHADCHKLGSVCVEGAAERVVEGFRVYRDCWKYQDKFECTFPSKGDCKPLADEGCYQVKSDCLARVHDKCVNYEQTYNCVRDQPGIDDKTLNEVEAGDSKNLADININCAGEIRCLDGSCDDQSYKPNNEMGEAIAQLTALSEIKNYIGEDFDQNSLSIFKGDAGDNSCGIGVVDSFDCCGEDDGWALSLHLTKCGSNEIALHKKREENKCVRIGRYCAEKVLGACIRHKVSYCCFDNKLIKTIQEQGRSQLGIDYGTPEQPNCRGFSAEELSKIDFSKLDLSEYASDILGKYQTKAGTIAQVNKDIGAKVNRLQQDYKSNGAKSSNKNGNLDGGTK